MANSIDANIRVSEIRLSNQEERKARVTFELDFGENRCDRLYKITIEVKPDYAYVNSALPIAREELAQCLSLMANQLRNDPVDDWT